MAEKLAKKLIREIKVGNLPSDSTIREFGGLGREESAACLRKIIELEEDVEIKKRLIEIYDCCHWIHDKNLLLLSIWSSYGRRKN